MSCPHCTEGWTNECPARCCPVCNGTGELPGGFRYYVCRIGARDADKAVEALRKQGVHSCAPSETVWRRSVKGRKRQARPLLVGYLFVSLDPQAPAFRACRDACPELGAFVGSGSPRPVPPGFVEQLLQAEQAGAFDRTRKPERKAFKPGQPVKVVAGPFAGLVGAFVRASGTDRARVLLDALNAPADLDAGALTAA